MTKAHKIRLNPTPAQESYFKRAAGIARFVFNWGLEHWKKKDQAGEKPSAFDLKKEFNALKVILFPFVLEVTKTVAEGAFINLGRAFTNFFEGRSNYPHFKSRKDARQSFYLANDQIKFKGHSIHIPKLGWVNMTEELRLAGKVMSATVSYEAGWWWLSVQVEMEPPAQRPKTEVIGIDLGLHDLAVTSEGQVFENQKHLKAGLGRIQGLSKSLSRKVRGSANFLKAKCKLSRAHFRVKSQRDDATHKMTTQLARDYVVIGIEDLNVAGMVKNHNLAQSLNDAAFGEVRRQLEYKARWFGSRLQTVDRFFPSSQICSECGERKTDLTLAIREWTCESCGATHHRDVNAARNIRNEVLRRLGSGYVESLNSPVDSLALAI
jgi:putative transposase